MVLHIDVRGWLWMLPRGVQEMSINYSRMWEMESLAEKGFFKDPNIPKFNWGSWSELEERIKVMDEKDVYIIIRTIIDNHRDLLVRVLEYLEKEGASK